MGDNLLDLLDDEPEWMIVDPESMMGEEWCEENRILITGAEGMLRIYVAKGRPITDEALRRNALALVRILNLERIEGP